MATTKSNTNPLSIDGFRWETAVINREGPIGPDGKKTRIPVGEGKVVYPMPLNDTSEALAAYVAALAPDAKAFTAWYLRGNGIVVKVQAWGRHYGETRSTTDDAAKADILEGLRADGLKLNGTNAGATVRALGEGAKRAYEAAFAATMAALAGVKMTQAAKEAVATEAAEKAAEAVMTR